MPIVVSHSGGLNKTQELAKTQKAAAQTNVTSGAANSKAKEENHFAKMNPFADFSSFEKKVEEMKPLAPDAHNQKMVENLAKQMEQKKVEAPAIAPMSSA